MIDARKLYLAGPMSGYPEHNFPLFHRVAQLLRERGHEVFNPAENKDGGVARARSFYMRLDIPALLTCEAVVLLPGWQGSRGACLEVWIALDLDMPIYACVDVDSTVTLERVRPELECLPFGSKIEDQRSKIGDPHPPRAVDRGAASASG